MMKKRMKKALPQNICRALGLSICLLVTQEAIGDEYSTAVDTVNSFEKLFGVTEGKRRNHTKGFCFTATLTPSDKEILKYTNSPLFTSNSTVTGRLSHKGGNNAASDAHPAEYGMGLSISTLSGEEHLMSMNTLDFFPVRTPEAFAELMLAKTQGSDAVKAFKQKNKDLQRFKAHVSKKEKKLTPYEGTTFNSINSFYLINDNGDKTAVRWSFVPSQGQAVVLEPKQDFFFENMQKNLSDHKVSWDMVVTLANDEDEIDNAALAWIGNHQKINAAQLVVSAINTEKEGQCDKINFDPLVLSSGFEESEDPLLQARRNAYAISFTRRTEEKE